MKKLNIKSLMLFISVLIVTSMTAYARENDNRHAHMQNMHDHMTAMHAQMQAIHAEKNPEKGKQLMQAHRQSMHEGMKMMHKMGHKGKMGMMHGEKHKANKKEESADNCKQMEHMGHRMDMMNQMMEQMMLHEDAHHRHHASKQ